MQATCPHVDLIADVNPGAIECEACAGIGGTWVNLRQCRVCGRTGCCDSSPNKHASAHFHETGHPIMRSLEEGHDWSWCFVCRTALRQDEGGRWQVADSFFEAGLHYAHRLLADGGSLPFAPGIAVDGFPLSVWETTYRGRHRAGTIDPDQATELEALPGWAW